MSKAKRLGPGDPVTFKIPVSTSKKEIELLNRWRKQKILASKIMEKVKEEAGIQQKGKLVLNISRSLTDEEMERLAIPEVQEMLGNICLALLAKQVPALPIGTNQTEQQPIQSKEGVNASYEIPEEAEGLIDDLFDDF